MGSDRWIDFEELKMLVWQSLGRVYWLASAHGGPTEEAATLPKHRCGHCGGVMRDA